MLNVRYGIMVMLVRSLRVCHKLPIGFILSIWFRQKMN